MEKTVFDKFLDWKPKVGDEVFVHLFNSHYSSYKTTITKVGRKYFTIESLFSNDVLVDIVTKEESNKNYSPSFRVYRSEEDYRQACRLHELISLIPRYLMRLSQWQLEAIGQWIKWADMKKEQ